MNACEATTGVTVESAASRPDPADSRYAPFALMARCALAGVVLYSSIGKLLSGYASVGTIVGQSGLFPAGWVPHLRDAIPYLEVAWGVALLCPRWQRPILGASALIIAGFTAVLLAAGYRSGWGQACGCAGLLTRASVGQTVVRNAALLALAGVALVLPALAKRRRAVAVGPIADTGATPTEASQEPRGS